MQNVSPALLVRFLREHRSEWADYNVDAYSAASLKSGSYSFQGLRLTGFSGGQIIMPLAHTVEHEEVLTFFLKIIMTPYIRVMCIVTPLVTAYHCPVLL